MEVANIRSALDHAKTCFRASRSNNHASGYVLHIRLFIIIKNVQMALCRTELEPTTVKLEAGEVLELSSCV